MPNDPIDNAIQDAQRRHNLFPQPSSGEGATPLVVGVSGGADSVCLLHALLRLAAGWGLELHVAHLDHGLRPDSAEDAAFVVDLAARWGVPCHSQRLTTQDLAQEGPNLEAAARRLRYRFLAHTAHSLTQGRGVSSLPLVAVAHTADDQAETVIMHMLRGSGLRGLAGMSPVVEMDPDDQGRPVTIVRPLLSVSRTDVLRYLDDWGLAWREDPSNQDTSFTRNRLRHQLLPRMAGFNPNLIATLGRTAAVLAAEAERADRLDRAAFAQAHLPALSGSDAPPLRVVMDLDRFHSLDVATQRGVLRLAAGRLQMAEALTFEHVEDMRLRLLGARGAGGPFSLSGGYAWTVAPPHFSIHRNGSLPFLPDHPHLSCRWRRVYGSLRIPVQAQVQGHVDVGAWRLIWRKIRADELPADWRSRKDPWRAFLDMDQVGNLLLAAPQPGQRFAPLGLHGQHKSLGDFFTDNKIPAPLRPGWPLLIDGRPAQVVWVSGLRLAHHVRITPETQTVLHLQWLRQDI